MTEDKRDKLRKLINVASVRPSINDGLDLLDMVDALEPDRDRWKARAEALERALKSQAVNAWNAPYCPACATCKNNQPERQHNCAENCTQERRGWVFDEQEFREG